MRCAAFLSLLLGGCSLVVPGPDSFEYRDASTPMDAAPDAQPPTADAGGDSGVCAAGEELCQSECVDLQTTAAHCGACGNDCEPGQVCMAGACADPAVSVSASAGTTCVLTGTRRALCWGSNAVGQVGGGVDDEVVVEPVDVGLSEVVQIQTGGVTCAVTGDGNVWCWGSNIDGQLGDRALGASRNAPVRVSGLPMIQEVAVGGDHVCARAEDGAVFCWGANDVGQLGDGTTEERDGPVRVSLERDDALAVVAGASTTCALRSPRVVRCWGAAPVGDGSMVSASFPVAVGLSGVERLVADTGLLCGISAGQPRCWGVAPGALGADSTEPFVYEPLPIAALSLGSDDRFAASSYFARFAEIQLAAHACSVSEMDGLRCWGFNHRGELGIDSSEIEGVREPAPVALEGVVDVAVGSLHTCAVTREGRVYCWGSNRRGELGVGDIEDKLSPALVPGFPRIP